MKLVLSIIVLLITFQNLCSGRLVVTTGCELDINKNLYTNAPLFIQANSLEFVRSNNGKISFKPGEGMRLACTGLTNFLSVKGANKKGGLDTARCISGTKFKILGNDYDISKIVCQRWPEPTHRKNNDKCWNGKADIFNIGFQILVNEKEEFINMIDVCHDTTTVNTYYTSFILRSDVFRVQEFVPDGNFSQGGIFESLTFDELYKPETQQKTVGILLNDINLAKEKIHLEGVYRLSKGNLVAKADFIYQAQQRATFYYSNTAPQWQTLKGNNWNTLENSIRKYAGKLGKDFEIHTGTYGIDTLHAKDGKHVKLFLNGKDLLPVPMIFWKIVYNPDNQHGIVFLGINSPHNEITIKKYLTCTDICKDIEWLNLDEAVRRNREKGYVYCCEVKDFLKQIPTLLEIKFSGILKQKDIS